MINLPNTLSKGEVLSFALNKSLVLAAVVDSYWSDAANISKCVVVYASTSGHQRKRLEFDFSQESPTVVAEWSIKARNAFEIEEIVLIDFDSGSYTVPRSSLPSGKGISFAGEGGGGGSVVVEVAKGFFPNGQINEMIADGNDLFIAGNFSSLRFSGNRIATISSTTAENQLKTLISASSGFPVFNNQIECFAFDGPDTLYVGGLFTRMNQTARWGIAKLIKSGNDWISDTTFNRTNGGTTPWNAPNTVGFTGVYSICVTSDRILVGGSFSGWRNSIGVSSTVNGFVAINKSTFAVEYSNSAYTNRPCYDIKIDGEFNWSCYYNNPNTPIIKRANSTGAVQSLSLPSFAQFITCYALEVTSDAVYVAGDFVAPKYHVIKLNKNDGSLISQFTPPWTSKPTGQTALSLLFKDDSLFVGGNWNNATIGKNLVKLNSTTGAQVTAFNAGNSCFRGGSTSSVNEIIDLGSSIAAVGLFNGKETGASAATNNNIVKLNAVSGVADTTFNSLSALQGVDSGELLKTAVVSNDSIIIGGQFSGWGGYSISGVAKLSKDLNGNWQLNSAFNPGLGGSGVSTLAISGNDLYIGGSFTTWNGQTRNRVAKLNKTTGVLDSAFGVGVFTSGIQTGQFNGVSAQVNKIKIDGSDLVLAGSFTTYSKKSSEASLTTPATPYWIRVNTSTNTESVPSFGSNGVINGFDVDETGIYVAGNFTTWAGVTRTDFAKADKITGTLDSTFNLVGGSNQGKNIYVLGDRIGVTSTNTSVVVSGTSRSGAFFFANKTTGAPILGYASSQFGGAISDYSSVVQNDQHIYVLVGRTTATSASSGWATALIRIKKADYTVDTSWGFWSSSPYHAMAGVSAAIVGDQILLSTALSNAETQIKVFEPMAKGLYAFSLTTGQQMFNI